MTDQMKQLLKKETPALALLCDQIDQAVDFIIKEGLEHIDENGESFVFNAFLTQFGIDPKRDLRVIDAIYDRINEHPAVYSFSTDFQKKGRSCYYIEFHLPVTQEILAPAVLGPARKAELFDMQLSSFEGLLEDQYAYEILCGIMTEEEIRASGFRFEHENEKRTQEVLNLLGGADPRAPDRPTHPCKLQELLNLPLPFYTYLEHVDGNTSLMAVDILEPNNLISEQLTGWEDVMQADVIRVFPGAFGVHAEIGGVDAQRLSDFYTRACNGSLQPLEASAPQMTV